MLLPEKWPAALLVFQKEIDSSFPYLMKAVATGQTLKSAEFKWYKINDAGQEAEYIQYVAGECEGCLCYSVDA